MDRKTALKMRLKQIIREHAQQDRRPVLGNYSHSRGGRMSLRRLFEDANPAQIDPERFPTKLSDAGAVSNIKQYVTQGPNDGEPLDDDKVGVSEGASFSCQELKPSQTSMNIGKAMGMALGMIKSGKAGGNLGAFISSDLYIMDGHHRWISTAMVDPSAKITGILVNLPGQQLVGVLNALTAGKFGHAGKPASGGFDQFKEAPIKAQLEKNMKEGVGGDFPISAEEVTELVKKFGGDLDGCVKKFVENLSTITMSTPGWAPERPDMPVIEKEDSGAAKKALSGGEIDLNPPYAGGEGGEETKKESRYRSGHVVVERWQKLAGILKG